MDANANASLPTVADTHVPVGSQLTITIGRNQATALGTAPMAEGPWAGFKSLVSLVVVNHLAPTLDFGWFTGEGQWEGVTEESAIRVIVTGKAIAPDRLDLLLGVIADTYGQDAIAWSYGPNLLANRVR
jgi:hypothetical protein